MKFRHTPTREIRDRRLTPDDPAWTRALQRARIPERYWVAEADKVRTDQAWLRRMLEEPLGWLGRGWGFYVHGDFDTGKSCLAAVLAMEAVSRCERVLWISAREVAAVRFHSGDEMTEVDAKLSRADLLVLDDLGGERFGLETAGGTALEEVIRVMFDRGRSVIVASNIHWNDLKIRYGVLPAFISVLERILVPVVLVQPFNNRPGIEAP